MLRTVRGCLATIILFAAVMSGAAAASAAAANRSPAASEEATPKQIQELMTLLADPKVRDWLEQESKAKAAQARASDGEASSISHEFDSRVGAIREHIVALGTALPDLPDQIEHAHGLVSADLGDQGRIKGLSLLAVFVALGFGVEWLFRRATGRIRARLDGLPVATVHDRLRIVAVRFAFAVGLVAAFALGSVGAFLALDWPPLLREMVFGYLLVFLVIRVAVVVGHFLLSPHHEHFRIIPLDTAAARFWHRRLVVFVGWFAFGYVEVGVLSRLGLSLAGHRLRTWPWSARDGAGGSLAPPRRAGRQRGSAGSQRGSAGARNASPRTRRTKRVAVDRHRAVMGALGTPRHGGFLARSGRHHPAARHKRDPPRG